MGHKGPVLRPRCIGPGRAQTRILKKKTEDRGTDGWLILKRLLQV